MNALFFSAQSTHTKLLLAVVVSITLMTADHRFKHLEALRSSLSYLIAPIQYIVDIPAITGSWAAHWFSSHTTLLKKNARLRDEQLILKARLQKYRATATENERLRELLGSSSNISEQVIVAELLAVDMDPYKKLITLNKGSNHGLLEGQAIIDANGVMGQLIHTGPITSTAMLISDPSHAIPIRVNRTGLRGIAFGSNHANELRLHHIPATSDINVGDLLITSGLGGRFPANYPVATVSRVNRIPGQGFAEVIATPIALLERSREVLVIRPQNMKKPAAAAKQERPKATDV